MTGADEPAAVDDRAVAVATFNRAWELLSSDRTAEQDRDLLGLAFASRYHWSRVGHDPERAVADWMVSRCLLAVGDRRLALSFAHAGLDRVTADMPAWLRASMHEGVARACAESGDAAGRDRHVAFGRAALELESDPEDRDLVSQQLDDASGR